MIEPCKQLLARVDPSTVGPDGFAITAGLAGGCRFGHLAVGGGLDGLLAPTTPSRLWVGRTDLPAPAAPHPVDGCLMQKRPAWTGRV